MSKRGIVLEIAGHDYAYATHANAPTVWADQVVQSVISVPTGSAISVDFDTYKADTGGSDVEVTDAAASLVHFSTAVTARLDGIHSAAIATITVDSTTSFSSPAGIIWVGGEAIRYAGTGATTFTGCTRAYIGTTATSHPDDAVVYSYAPTFLGRKCILRWYDLLDTSSTTTRYTGFIDAVDFGAGGYRISILSSKKAFEDSKGLHLQQGKGRVEVESHKSNWFELSFHGEEQGGFITLPATSANWQYWYIRIDDEIIRYEAKHVIYHVYETTVASVTSAYVVVLTDDYGFATGRTIEFVSAGVIDGTGTIVGRDTGTSLTHNAAYSPTPGDTARVAGVAQIDGALRAALFTESVAHARGAEIAEYRVLEGNQVDILLWLMLSRDGDKTNSNFDILPVGWGAGIDKTLIDLAAFEEIAKPRASMRRYVLQEEIDILDLLGMVAQATNCRVFWGTDGILTCVAVSDIFPLDAPVPTLTTSLVLKNTIPQLRIDLSRVRNIWEWGSDYDLDGDRRAMMRVEITESRNLYGDRTMPAVEDKGMLRSRHNGITYVIAKVVLSQRAAPVSILTCEILFDETATYTPGGLVTVTLPHLPNMTGSGGITAEVFEILSYAPDESAAKATIVLAKRGNPAGLGHIAPACVVESVAANDVTVRPRSWSKYAPLAASFAPPGSGGQTGAEDVDWFLASDPVRFVDVSTFGAATPTSGVTTITSIDYPNRIVSVAAAPGFLAAGDLMQFDDWSTVLLGGTAGDRQSYFICLADDTTGLIDASDPFVWGI